LTGDGTARHRLLLVRTVVGVGIMGVRALCRVFALVVATGAAMTGTAGPAAAASIFELNFWLSGPRYDGVLPPCDAAPALDTISARFAQKERRFWESDLTITGYERIRETAFRPGPPNTIPRRYCSGTVLVSDGVKRTIHYSIAEATGMTGASWGVEWCVVGLDRNWAYNPACKMARP
jgi:hypothetical protein